MHLLLPPGVVEKLESLTTTNFSPFPTQWESDYMRNLLVNCAPTLRYLAIDDLSSFIANLPHHIPFPKLEELRMHTNIHGCIIALLSCMRLPATTRVNFVHKWEGPENWSPSIDIFTDYMLSNTSDPLHLERCLPMLSKTRRFRIQAGTNLYWSGYVGDKERPAWKAATDLGRPPVEVTLTMLGPMIRNAYRILCADVLEELECHFAPHIDPYEHWPDLIYRFRKLKKLTFGPTYSVTELLSDFVYGRRGLPSLEEMTFCVPEVADELVRELAQCKKAKLRRGITVLPPIVIFRLPSRLSGDLQTRLKLAKLANTMSRLTKIQVEYRDCSFCHRAPRPGDPIKLIWDGSTWVPPPRRVVS
ncbi:hypothetical protein C8Q73DRAFT_662427 [Cubamyces lactineus]|nr:hypothetical protein C8Q73DRAFT_662427 [Cubamyces lactineus]